MSVLTNFAIFPTDKGESVSEYVSKVVEMISKSGFEYKLTAMGTIFETENFEQALEILNKSYIILKPYSNRVYCSANFDIQTSKPMGRIIAKEKSINDKLNST